MARWVYMLTAFAGLAAWAGAQHPAPPLSAEDRLRLLKTNATLIDNLVREGVELSKAGLPEDRAARCRGASLALANEIREAARAENAERVVELTGLFHNLVRDGLVPTINDGLKSVPPQSPSAVKLREVRGLAVSDVTNVKSAIPSTGKLGDNQQVREALKNLDELAEALK
jgi:hypothetical protein